MLERPDDVRVNEALEQARLVEEHREHLVVVAEIVTNDLQRHERVVADAAPEIQRRETAAGDLPEDVVTSELRRSRWA